MRNKQAGVCSRTAILPRGQQHRRHLYNCHLDSVAAGMCCACGNAHVHSEIQRTNRLFKCAKRSTTTHKQPKPRRTVDNKRPDQQGTVFSSPARASPRSMDTSLPSQVRRHPRHRSYCSATSTRRRGQIPASK